MNGLFFRGCERRLLCEYDDRNSVFIQCAFGNDDEVASWIRDAELVKSFRGDRDNAEGFTRFAEFPARDGDHAVGLEVFEVLAKGFDGVKTIFAERECAGSG